jgi:hypothetical protein
MFDLDEKSTDAAVWTRGSHWPMEVCPEILTRTVQ